MKTRVLDLDDSVVRQRALLHRAAAAVLPLGAWGPRLRLACRFGCFRRFERDLASWLGAGQDGPCLTFVGSGDFHHVSLALLRRQPGPCNLLVLDNHPDWMRAVPLLHCGTWLHHAAALPQVARVFHVGGEVDFDNTYRWLAPWPALRSGKITVLPAVRRFRGAGWAAVPHQPLRDRPDEPATSARLGELLAPHRAELAELPLYVSLDKDVLRADEAVVNWDSGHLRVPEVLGVLEAFLTASAGLAGMDVVGDWSPVRVRGLLRLWLHLSEHPRLQVDPEEARRRNEALNLTLFEAVLSQPLGPGRATIPFPARPAGARRAA
jgi:hypothetical protein